jgi:hypothetical protein
MSIILGSFGDWQGAPVAPRCPERTVLIGIGATTSDKWIVSLNSLFCQDLNDVIAKQMNNVIEVTIPQNVHVHYDQGGAYSVKHMLAPGLAVTGANIRAGHRIEGLELFGRDAAMLYEDTVAKPYIGMVRGEVTSAEVPPSARAFAVGLNAQQIDDGASSSVTRFDLVCDGRTEEMYKAMASPGASSMQKELRKCIGVDSYGLFDSTFRPDVCTQFATHYCPSTPARLLECNNSHFCQLNPEFCDSAYQVLCQTIDNTNQKFCSCSYVNPQMLSFEGYKPACHNNDCYNKSVAYQTRDQASKHCTNIVVCLQDLLRTSVKQADLINVTYTNSCGLNASNVGPLDLAKQMMIDPDQGTADALAVHLGSVRGGSSAPATKTAPPVYMPGVPLPNEKPPAAETPQTVQVMTAAPAPAAPVPAPSSVPVNAQGRNEGADLDMAMMMSADDVASTTLPPATESLDPPPPSSELVGSSSSSLPQRAQAMRQEEPNYMIWLLLIIVLSVGTGILASRIMSRRW